MVYYLPTKTTRQIVSYFVNKKNHPSHNGEFKLTCLNWQGGLFDDCHFGSLLNYKIQLKRPVFVDLFFLKGITFFCKELSNQRCFLIVKFLYHTYNHLKNLGVHYCVGFVAFLILKWLFVEGVFVEFAKLQVGVCVLWEFEAGVFLSKPICGSEVWVVEDRIYGKRERGGCKLLELSFEFLVLCMSDFEVRSTTVLLIKQTGRF
jgi:hypothetical protein